MKDHYVVVSSKYFECLQKEVERIAEGLGNTDYKTMQRIVSLHEYLTPQVAWRETEKFKPSTDWNTVLETLTQLGLSFLSDIHGTDKQFPHFQKCQTESSCNYLEHQDSK